MVQKLFFHSLRIILGGILLYTCPSFAKVAPKEETRDTLSITEVPIRQASGTPGSSRELGRPGKLLEKEPNIDVAGRRDFPQTQSPEQSFVTRTDRSSFAPMRSEPDLPEFQVKTESYLPESSSTSGNSRIIAPEGTTISQEVLDSVKKTAPRKEAARTEQNFTSKRLRSKQYSDDQIATVTMADVNLPIDKTLTETEDQQAKATALNKLTQSGAIQLGQYLEPWKGSDPNERVEMNFDNKELSELLRFLADTLSITFILDDYIEPTRAEGLQPIAGTKITFKSTIPLSLKQAWEIGLTFIEMAGFSVIPATLPRTYRVTASASRDKPSANREPIPTFIGIDPELLPDNDTKIRYVYFAENAELPIIVQIIEAMKSGSAAPLIEVPPLRAIIMTDKAANIKSIMNILKEIDRVTLPETLAIIRLKHTDAKEVRELYHRLIGADPKSVGYNPYSRQRKPSTTHYFSEATRVFEEPYTNSLIVLGTRENIKRFEEFVIRYIDKTLALPFSPLHIMQLKYIDAGSVAKILNEVIQKFNAYPANMGAALVGGVRDGNKFFKPSVRITEEPSGNRLIINADYEEYLKLREIIEKLDVEQPQVAIKMLILNVDLTNQEQLGVQLRNSVACCDGTGGTDGILGTNVNFQTSMLGPIVTNPPQGETPPATINGAQLLLGNLVQLANQVNGVSPFDIGTTLVTLGKDLFGFWGLLRVLETYTRTSVIANPFFIATHKYKTEFKVGETRRTTTAIVSGQRDTQAQGDLSADLRIVITPQISYDDTVTLNVYVELGQFVDNVTQDRLIRKMSTESLLVNKEVLALGGFIQDRVVKSIQKVPVLGDLPLVGWLFRNETMTVEKTSLLILICPEIIKPGVADAFTYSTIVDTNETMNYLRNPAEKRDPVHRWLFSEHKEEESTTLDKFVATQQRYKDESQRSRETLALKPKPKKASPQSKGPILHKQKSLLDLVGDEKGVQAA